MLGHGRGSRTRRRRSRGQALVEFALVLPVFLLVLAGILDFGFMLYSRITLISAVRDGARVSISVTDKTTILGADGKSGIAPSTVIGSSKAGGLTVPATDVTVTCLLPDGKTTCNFAGAAPLAASGDFVRVTVDYAYKPFFPLFFGNTITLSATSQMVIE